MKDKKLMERFTRIYNTIDNIDIRMDRIEYELKNASDRTNDEFKKVRKSYNEDIKILNFRFDTPHKFKLGETIGDYLIIAKYVSVVSHGIIENSYTYFDNKLLESKHITEYEFELLIDKK